MPKVRPRAHWQDYVDGLAYSRLRSSPLHLTFAAEDRDANKLQLKLSL